MIKKIMKLAVIAGISVSMVSTEEAAATAYTVDLDGPLGNSGAGYLTNFKSIYNDSSNTLTLSTTVTEKDGRLANGFWFVLNGGGSANDASNPKGHGNELAVLYGDGTSGRLTAYIYNGQNNASSYNDPANFIQSFTSELSSTYVNGAGSADGISTFDFTIDLGLINDTSDKPANWLGIQYGAEVGLWYHPFFADAGAITYDNNGLIDNFSLQYAGWFDTNGTPTTAVPEPGVMGLMVMGFAGLVFYRRRRG